MLEMPGTFDKGIFDIAGFMFYGAKKNFGKGKIIKYGIF